LFAYFDGLFGNITVLFDGSWCLGHGLIVYVLDS